MNTEKYETEIDSLRQMTRQCLMSLVKKHGTQEAVASVLGHDGGEISKYISGQKDPPFSVVAVVFALAGFTLVETDEFMNYIKLSARWLDLKQRGKV